MKKLIISLFIMVLGISLSGAAYGATATEFLNVSANVVPACTVSTTAVNFGDTDGSADVFANGDVTVNCSSGIQYNIALDAGLNYDLISRRVSDGVNYIRYELYKDAANANQWADSDFANTYPFGLSVPDTGDGTDQPHIVYGYLSSPSGPVGTYTDVITVTVHY
jgi:spore coat protein U-like protein